MLQCFGAALLKPLLKPWVRCRTRRSRARNTRAAAWACSLLGATKRMVGRCAASQIASASVALFFCRLTNGLTYAGGISRTACPSMPISRAQLGAAAGLYRDHAGGLGR